MNGPLTEEDEKEIFKVLSDDTGHVDKSKLKNFLLKDIEVNDNEFESLIKDTDVENADKVNFTSEF